MGNVIILGFVWAIEFIRRRKSYEETKEAYKSRKSDVQ